MRTDRAAELIRRARQDVGMSQEALASAAHMQQPTISAYESGRQQPRAESLERILRAARTRPSIHRFPGSPRQSRSNVGIPAVITAILD